MSGSRSSSTPESRLDSGTTSASAGGRRRRLLLRGAALALGLTVARVEGVLARPLACAVPPREPMPFAAPDPAVGWSAPSGPVPTGVAVTRDGYIYHVGRRPETIRGMGYNPPIAGWTQDRRRRRMERDLSLMAAAGVNTLIGWSPAVIDGLTLDVAHELGIGVALPFGVDFTLDMRDPAVRDAFVTTVLTWVDQYKEHPALRIWTVGNEVLQRTVPPTWCSAPPTDEQSTWSSAWSGLLVDLADAIHARDPLHPVLYREADDAYTPWLAQALRERPGERRWLIYGVNVYNPRPGAILGRWPGRGIPTSLLVSEFAPLGAPLGQRAVRLREIWSVVRSFPAFVLGGAAYVWSTDGPEAVDRQLGLVDERGIPVDDGLDTIGELYAATARNPRAQTIGSLTE